MKNEIILWLCGFAGLLFHTLAKGNSLLQDARVANINFHFWKDYIFRDALSIFLALNSIWIWYLVYKEVFEVYPAGSGLVRVSFVAFGFMGSYIVQLFMSRAKKAIRSKVDGITGYGPKSNL